MTTITDEQVELMARAIREEIVRQYRDDERGKCPAGACFYEEYVGPEQIARAALTAAAQAGKEVMPSDTPDNDRREGICVTPPGSAPDTLGRAEGWKLVPKELSYELCKELVKQSMKRPQHLRFADNPWCLQEAWLAAIAMLAASPSHPPRQQHDVTNMLADIRNILSRARRYLIVPLDTEAVMGLVDEIDAVLAASPSPPAQSGEEQEWQSWCAFGNPRANCPCRGCKTHRHVATLTADIDRWHELSEARLRAIDDYRSQIATLTKELAEARDQQISAVNGMLQAEVELAEAQNELFDLRCRAGCGPDQEGLDVWQQLAEADKAIKPFAKWIAKLDAILATDDASLFADHVKLLINNEVYLTYGNFRAVRAFQDRNKTRGETM